MNSFVARPCDQHLGCAAASRGTRVSATAALIAAILASGMSMIDGTAVNVALPIVQRELHASSADIQWVVEGYALFVSALLLVGGALGDRYGRRRMFVLGTAIFAVASIACALAASSQMLVAARCIQGVGGALMIPESLALITSAYDEKARGRAIGTWSAASAVTTILGPVLGGWLTQDVTWRAIFLINVPLAIAVVVIALLYVRESHDESETGGRPDVLGGMLATIALGALVFGLIRYQDFGADVVALASMLGGAILLALFLAVERTAGNPMLRLSLFKSRTFALANLYTLVMYAALGGALFFVPFYLINVEHYSPTAAGAALLPMILILALFSRSAGAVADRIGPRVPLIVGALIAAVGFALFGIIGTRPDYWTTVFPAALTLGIGATIFVAPLTTSVMNSAPRSESGSAAGINNAVSRVAGMLAVAIFGIIVVSVTRSHLGDGAALPGRDALLSGIVPPGLGPVAAAAFGSAYAAGFESAMLAGAALAVLAAASAAFLGVTAVTAGGGRQS